MTDSCNKDIGWVTNPHTPPKERTVFCQSFREQNLRRFPGCTFKTNATTRNKMCVKSSRIFHQHLAKTKNQSCQERHFHGWALWISSCQRHRETPLAWPWPCLRGGLPLEVFHMKSPKIPPHAGKSWEIHRNRSTKPWITGLGWPHLEWHAKRRLLKTDLKCFKVVFSTKKVRSHQKNSKIKVFFRSLRKNHRLQQLPRYAKWSGRLWC